MTELPTSTSPFKISSTVFSNKAFATTEITTEKKLIALAKNAFGVLENETSDTSRRRFLQVLSEKRL